MEFSKSELLLISFVATLITIIIVLIGKVGIYNQTGCWGECAPCAEQACSVELNPYNLDQYHEIPEPSTLLLVSAGVGILFKMRG